MMQYSRPEDPQPLRCFDVECLEPAKWEVYTGPRYEDVNHTCGNHFSELTEGLCVDHIVPVYPDNKSYIDFDFDPVEGLKTYAFYDNDVPWQGEDTARPVRAGEWVGPHKLRVPVPGGWLVGT